MKEPRFNFTPGPWEAGRNPAMATVLDGHEGKAIYPEGGFHHIGWANIHDDEGKLDMEAALANAVLMAQAPKMFNVLEKCLEYLKRCPMTRNAELETEIETTLEEATI